MDGGTQKRTIEIHGKQYETVASRVDRFREDHPNHTIATEIVRLDDDQVVVKASILAAGSLIATGHAQEFRASSQINKTSYVENCETSAIGRALAAFGIGGTEFATANEVQNAIHQQANPGKGPTHTPTSDAWESQTEDMKVYLTDKANNVRTLLARNDDAGAWDELTEKDDELDEHAKVALWTRFDSKERSRLKKAADVKKGAK